MAGLSLSQIRPLYWAIAWSLCQFTAVSGQFLTSLVPRQTGSPGSRPWGPGQGPPPWASSWLICAGHTDYNGCAPFQGSGCCPQGLACQADGYCVAGITTSTTSTVVCDKGWFGCSSGQGGGCCLNGQVCGSGDCTSYASVTTTSTSSAPDGHTTVAISTFISAAVTNQIDPNLTAIISTVISGTETVPQLSRTLFGNDASTGSRESQAAATSTGSSSSGGDTGSSVTGERLTAGQIGGISAGAVVGFLLLVALGWLLVRHLIRISRFMDKFNSQTRERLGQSTAQGRGEHKKEDDLKILNDSNGGDKQLPTELSPQERPQLLDEWGRHGSRGNELGGQEAHHISELDGTSVNR
ncbi:hypothetical protein KVR01_012992 [Diaporthe batatas]|uniref:uncharacterized protein n=1 Tax=Diaporthe batatas TaxID=748121 RepID=UPI001D0475F6|nr:uncharacterized protein KVR01_012992 [Diaporthe batatas]KAG8157284.1 hypothetical protein KVR01_012992 [Diaporthe batatas]